jgi:hypothetical protein
MHLTTAVSNPVKDIMAPKRGIYERTKGQRHLVDSLDGR